MKSKAPQVAITVPQLTSPISSNLPVGTRTVRTGLPSCVSDTPLMEVSMVEKGRSLLLDWAGCRLALHWMYTSGGEM